MAHLGLCPVLQPATCNFGLVKSKKHRANHGHCPCRAPKCLTGWEVHETHGPLGTVPSHISREAEQCGPRKNTLHLSVASPMWSIHLKHPLISQRYLFSVSPLTAKTLSKWGRIRGYHTLVSCWKPDTERLSNKRSKYKQRSINQSRSDRFNRISLQLIPRLFNWGTIVEFDNKYKLQLGTIWHCSDTKKQTFFFFNSEIYFYMISLTFNNARPFLIP